ncbi:MAG TPA: amidase [Mycobacteriales bacterium]|nr:amidase [Mycobacteriales bacterium]
MAEQVHAYGDDALADHDGIALAALIRSGEISRREVVEAALLRADKVDAALHAVQVVDAGRALRAPVRPGPFSGVPTFVKDNTDLVGYPTNHGSEAFVAPAAKRDAPFARTLLQQGLVPLGKSRLPEFGFNATTEFMTQEPVRNPWDTDFSAGASSGGSAALVAAGVVPLAHANDGGGSIRIPAAACGLVGLKPTRGRFVAGPLEHVLPLNIVGEGVVTRTVRDTAHFFAHAEQVRRTRPLAPVGLVEGPGARRLRIGLVLDSVTGIATDYETRTAVSATGRLLGDLGHDVVEMPAPMDQRLADDFVLYWGLLGFLTSRIPARALPELDRSRFDALTLGLSGYYGENRRETLGAVRRLRASRHAYARALTGYDAVLTPVLAHTTPPIGHLAPTLPFEQLLQRLIAYASFTPLNNATGSPAISLPLGATTRGLPIGVHLMGPHGGERALLELAYELEAAQPFRRLS